MANARVELPILAAKLKAAGAVGIKREMVTGLRVAAAPIIPLIQDEARAVLPKGGGLNEYVAAKPWKVSVRTTGRTAGVSIKSANKGNYTNEGFWRHPVYGHRNRKWAVTSFDAGKDWLKRGAEKGMPEGEAAARAVLEAIAVQVQGLGI